MIVCDYSQTAISNLMVEIGGRKDVPIDADLVRHMIINSIRGYNHKFRDEYGELVIACDSKNYWRRDFFEYYKAHRKRDREESGYDWKTIFEILASVRDDLDKFFPYKVINVPGSEADDVIAALAEWSQENDTNAIGIPNPFLIISGDHDFLQLQKYSNVKQYNPIQKKMVTLITTPQAYVVEHIVRGDKGDGIPNVLSSDDAIVAGERQKPVSSKKLSEWIANPASMPQDDTFKRNYQRNQTLVDLSFIPSEVKSSIINSYVTQPKKDRSQLLSYFMKHRMKLMMQSLEEF